MVSTPRPSRGVCHSWHLRLYVATLGNMPHYVYILSSRNKTLYTGLTNNIRRGVREHRSKRRGFTSRYNITRLV